MNQDQNDQQWLDELRKTGEGEAHRVGAALRRRFETQIRQTPSSREELQRLEARLEKESLLKGVSAKPGTLTGWIIKFFSPSWQWAAPLTAIALAALWILSPVQKNIEHKGDDDFTAYRGLELTQPTKLYTDLDLAGHQFQIVSEPLQAESQWKSALIEAGVTFDSYRSKSLPDAIEIHIRLSPAIDRLEPSFSLPKAPHQGEWIVYLIPEKS